VSEIVRIPLNELEEGMVIIKFNVGGFSFLHYNRPFPDKSLVEYLERNGVTHAFVRSDDTQKAAVPQTGAVPQGSSKYIKEYLDSLSDKKKEQLKQKSSAEMPDAITRKELYEATQIHHRAKQVTAKLLTDMRLGRIMDTEAARGVVTDLVDHCIRAPEAFVNMTRLKDFDNYTFTHSVNVSVLAIAIGRRLGFSAQEMNSLGFAALLHDIGKMKVPEAILNKPGKLTEQEFDIMKLHPGYGYEYLRMQEGVNEEICSAVHYHHEKSDGSGYPDGLTEKNIPRFAKIISIADVYDAITSERSYHKGIVPSEALKVLFSWSGKHFNDALVKFFISIMGIYPVGTLVVLDTNELAIILEPNKSEPMRPKVLIISNAKMERLSPMFFDLAKYNVLTHMPYKSIVSALDPRDFSIDPNKVIEEHIAG
jgi:putative nucleotidyltransferase with HDIG domain